MAPPASRASSSRASGSKLRSTPARSSASEPTGEKVAALDVADGGKDRSALCIRYGVRFELCKSRSDLLADGAGPGPMRSPRRRGCQRLLYDNIGVGAGAAASLRDKTDIKVQGVECGRRRGQPHAQVPGHARQRGHVRQRQGASLVDAARSVPGDVQGKPRRSPTITTPSSA